MSDAGRVAPISACVLCLRLELAFSGSGTFYHTTTTYTPSILHLTLTRHNSLVINTLLSVRYYKFHLHATYTQPTRNLHTPHAATRHKHGRMASRHRGTGKSVAPTDFSTSQWCTIHRIRQNRLCGSGMWCVRCMQGCVWYFELILHAWNLCVSTCYAQKV